MGVRFCNFLFALFPIKFCTYLCFCLSLKLLLIRPVFSCLVALLGLAWSAQTLTSQPFQTVQLLDLTYFPETQEGNVLQLKERKASSCGIYVMDGEHATIIWYSWWAWECFHVVPITRVLFYKLNFHHNLKTVLQKKLGMPDNYSASLQQHMYWRPIHPFFITFLSF